MACTILGGEYMQGEQGMERGCMDGGCNMQAGMDEQVAARPDEPTEGANREDKGEGGVEARAPPSGTVKKGLRLAGRADAEKDGAPATLSAAPVHAGDARIREC